MSKPGLLFDLKNITKAGNRISPKLKLRGEQSQSHILRCCTCGIAFTRKYRYWTSLQLSLNKSEEHRPSCRHYRCCKKSWTLGMQVLLPQLLQKAIEFSFSITSGAGGFALSPGLATSRIINTSESPAFNLVQTAYQDLKRTVGFQPPFYLSTFHLGFTPFDWSESAAVEAENLLNNLIHDIDSQFASGEASAWDQDENGKTLLHVSNSLFGLITLLDSYSI